MNITEEELKSLKDSFSACSPLFTALGDEIRQKLLLDIIDTGDEGANVMTLTSMSHLSRPAISHHLKILKDTGFVKTIKTGTQVFYRIDINRNLENINALIQSIQKILEKVKNEGTEND